MRVNGSASAGIGLILLGASLILAGELQVDGIIETGVGIRFPDGTLQTSAYPSALAPVEDTGQRACWDEFGAVTPCGGTGQDGEFQYGVDWPNPRFTMNGDGTVTDLLTRLTWLQNANCFNQRTWFDAISDANNLTSGQCGLTDESVAGDWRLPNVKELASLVDYGREGPALPTGYPFTNVQSSFYWSSTTQVQQPGTFAWYVYFNLGSVSWDGKTNDHYVWPVTGGF